MSVPGLVVFCLFAGLAGVRSEPLYGVNFCVDEVLDTFTQILNSIPKIRISERRELPEFSTGELTLSNLTAVRFREWKLRGSKDQKTSMVGPGFNNFTLHFSLAVDVVLDVGLMTTRTYATPLKLFLDDLVVLVVVGVTDALESDCNTTLVQFRASSFSGFVAYSSKESVPFSVPSYPVSAIVSQFLSYLNENVINERDTSFFNDQFQHFVCQK